MTTKTKTKPATVETKATTKIATMTALLERKQGATLEELVAATGWQTHSVRAALTGLRKKGAVIEKTRRNDATCYAIVGSSQ